MPSLPRTHNAGLGRKLHDAERGTAAQRGYDYRWQQYTKVFLSEHPLCVRCKARGDIVPATVVDHIEPHRGNEEMFWNSRNHQPLCKPDHDKKTVEEDGGFGR